MSKLSNSLKAFINAPHVRPNTTPAPKNIRSVYEKIAQDASSKQVGLPAWLTATTAATMTLNSPQSMLELYGLATSPPIKNSTAEPSTHDLWTAELMREIGLKCIGLNGVPRTINTLGEFFAGLPTPIQESLKRREPRRHLTKDAIERTTGRGHKLWESVYRPFSQKLTDKLAQSHPDLPVFIIEGEYGALFSDPPSPSPDVPNVGRVLMSILAVSVLRTQTGVGPQVVSHIFGLRKAYEDGTAEAEEKVEGGEWLAGNEGSEWLLARVDEVVEAIGHNFAQGYGEPKAKL
ncbi:Dol-P-Man:Man(5)GlcNAc(2)-PP-Dol alpha-1,3-mannosyltransferase [Teratosphaeria destructans]|uniref:Dol-P-Man:Man(5)GlcNAc(2)-PP-Dol alpha-1,3-mannosyltransferase n=1 Tax=Teratosphaeria destructans TaxID=418781 RepID=A0A9W7W712_9PEZI|nr:Dol-P-Man:Man(5)GlcNAc(2)-PP-Dol alpha-1,3-mannosyltransferase [Teratosphaeria destructans]